MTGKNCLRNSIQGICANEKLRIVVDIPTSNYLIKTSQNINLLTDSFRKLKEII